MRLCFVKMQTTITTTIHDLEFRLKQEDNSHVLSNEDDVTIFLPIGIELDMPILDWLSISKLSNSQAFIDSFIVDNIRSTDAEAPVRVSIDNELVTLSLSDTLQLVISLADWKKVADKIVLELVTPINQETKQA